jgi:hypothetical protein
MVQSFFFCPYLLIVLQKWQDLPIPCSYQSKLTATCLEPATLQAWFNPSSSDHIYLLSYSNDMTFPLPAPTWVQFIDFSIQISLSPNKENMVFLDFQRGLHVISDLVYLFFLWTSNPMMTDPLDQLHIAPIWVQQGCPPNKLQCSILTGMVASIFGRNHWTQYMVCAHECGFSQLPCCLRSHYCYL